MEHELMEAAYFPPKRTALPTDTGATTPKNAQGKVHSIKQFTISNKAPVKCYGCGQEGHFKNQCPQSINNPPRSGFTANPKANIQCYRCGRFGHTKRDCRVFLPPQGGQNLNSLDFPCTLYNHQGHLMKNCRKLKTFFQGTPSSTQTEVSENDQGRLE